MVAFLMTPVKTYRSDNQFRFNCPIFGSEVEIRQCFTLREQWARGKQMETRRGCQACLSASKCPIVPIMKALQQNPEQNDHYYSAEPKVGKLRPEILERIARIMVPQSTLNTFQPIPEGQARCIDAVDGLKGVAAMARNSGVDAAELEAVMVRQDSVYDYTPEPSKPRAPKSEPKSAPPAKVAAPNDMSAVVNSMMKEIAQ